VRPHEAGRYKHDGKQLVREDGYVLPFSEEVASGVS
jgi:hypothetical protein